MKVSTDEYVTCTECGCQHDFPQNMIDPDTPDIPHITDCDDCGEPISVVKVDDSLYEVSWG